MPSSLRLGYVLHQDACNLQLPPPQGDYCVQDVVMVFPHLNLLQMIWVESPTNPMMQVVDVAAVCKIAHSHPDVFVVTDNTFSTPYFQRPLDMGSDIVLHSLTKYMNGNYSMLSMTQFLL